MRLPCNDTELQMELNAYIRSDVGHTGRILDLAPGTPIRVQLDLNAQSIYQERLESEVLLHIPLREGRQVIAYSLGFSWANGVVLVPTLTKLVEAGAFENAAVNEEKSLLKFACQHKDNPELNLGLIWGALNLLALQGWVRMSGADQQARYSLTPIGAWVVKYVKENHLLFKRLAEAVSFLQHCHDLCHRRRVDASALAEYSQLVDLSALGWKLEPGDGVDAARAHGQLVDAMDGLLVGPTWIALDMPVFEPEGNQIVKRALSVFERFDENYGLPRGVEVPDLEAGFLRPAWSLLSRLGQIEESSTGHLRLSVWGEILRPIVAPYAALPASYLRTYERLQDLLFGNPDPLGIDRDDHVDRIMNVYGSSGAGSGPASRELGDKIIRRIFDHPDIDSQPAGIADMGCGDGSALYKLINYVLTQTVRGKHLKTHPLLVIGADYNESARARARANLAVLEEIEGVKVRILHADIGNPDAYDWAVQESGLTVRSSDGAERPAGLRDFLHTFMFLVHNRRLSIRDESSAEKVLLRQLAGANQPVLNEVMARYFPDRLMSDEQASLSLESVKSVFRVAYSDAEGIVPGFVAAADLVNFMERWKPFIVHGFLCVEGHSPCAENLLEPTPTESKTWMRVDKMPHAFNWGMHFPSRQFMMPFDEFMLALALAGFAPRDEVYGRALPEGFPSLDLAPKFRFFSIADYIPYVTPSAGTARHGATAATAS